MTNFAPDICIKIDPTNPGQFFACCGLLELADRLWGGAEGWFEGIHSFVVRRSGSVAANKPQNIFEYLANCELDTTVSAVDQKRLDDLAKPISVQEKAEKKAIEKKIREFPVRLDSPFNFTVDWFCDDRAGGSEFKTWAGQQSVVGIAQAMKKTINGGLLKDVDAAGWPWQRAEKCDDLPFNFDSDLSSNASAIDAGFSPDPLGIGLQISPALELLAFIGLQRFRPSRIGEEKRYRYVLWQRPQFSEVGAACAAGLVTNGGEPTYGFRLLCRTKYLKSFLPSVPLGDLR